MPDAAEELSLVRLAAAKARHVGSVVMVMVVMYDDVWCGELEMQARALGVRVPTSSGPGSHSQGSLCNPCPDQIRSTCISQDYMLISTHIVSYWLRVW